MARRKITVEDALRVLEEAGIPLQAKAVDAIKVSVEQPKVSPAFSKPQQSSKTVTITLFAKHSVGSGGKLVNVEGEKQVEDAGVETYGPGKCTVPKELASHLLSADYSAREADKSMLDREQKSYIVVQRRSPSGYIANVGVSVPNEVLDGGLGTLPMEYLHIIR